MSCFSYDSYFTNHDTNAKGAFILVIRMIPTQKKLRGLSQIHRMMESQNHELIQVGLGNLVRFLQVSSLTTILVWAGMKNSRPIGFLQ